jgi:hypothetical protein
MYQIKHDPIVNLNYFQVAGVYYLTHRDACLVYIVAQVYESSVVYNGVLSHVCRNRVQLQMTTDGVTVGSGRLAQRPCITSEFVEPA